MNATPVLRSFRRWSLLAAMLLASAVQAKVLDNFDAAQRTGWEDANPGGLPLAGGKQADGKFTFTLPALGQSFFVSSKKTSETFELKEGRTIEYRVDLVHGQGPDSFAILAFIPQATGPNTLAGYGIAKSETDILVTKGINKYFFSDNPTPAIKNDNVTLVLTLSVKGGNVTLRSRVLDKDAGDKVIFEKVFVDTPAADVMSDGKDEPPAPFVNLTGNFVLYLYADGGKDPAGYQVVYDKAETFVVEQVVLDDFDAAARTGWEDANPGGLPLAGGRQADGKLTFNLPALGQSFFVSSKKTTKSFELTEGTYHEFSVDLVRGQGPDSFAILAFIPQATGPNTLAGYGIAKSETDILVTKGINKYFFSENPTPAIKNENVRLTLALTVRDGNVTFRARVLDKDDGDKVIFEKVFVDTPVADVMSDGKDEPPAPFTHLTGNVVLYLYADGGKDPAGYQVVFDNLVASAPPAAANEPPIITEVAPSAGSDFLPASTALTFKVSDDKSVPDTGIKVVLNGVAYTTANGLKLGAAGPVRIATLGGFAADKSFSGEISITDSEAVTRTAAVSFDTFSAAVRTVEVEDYNFDAGGYIDRPVRTVEGGGIAPDSYTDRVGTPDVDFSDTRTAVSPADALYRTSDPIRTTHSLDRRRAGFDPGLEVFDHDVGDLAAGEWMNYTREFAPGSYEVYLREAVVNLAQADSVLEEVISDPTRIDQKVRLLGSFLGITTGFTSKNVPLTDGAGLNKVVLRLSGKKTLRLRQLTADTDTGSRLLNYLVFVPVADAGVQRATVTSLAPANNSVAQTAAPKVEAVVQNRDTSVVAGSVKLSIEGVDVAAVVTAKPDGATVAYVFPTLPPREVVQHARLVFSDNEGVSQTNDWSFTVSYLQLDPAARLAGPGPVRGFKIHATQATEQGENSLERAEAQLAAGSTITKAYDVSGVEPLVNFSQNAIDGGTDGYFDGDAPVPGQTAETGNDNIAMEALTFLELPAGVVRFGVRCDDGYKIASAVRPDASTVPLAFHNGGPADETFDVVVPQAGVYPFRLVWYERGGGAHVEWFTVDPVEGFRKLVNSPVGIRAYTSAVAASGPVLLASDNVAGPYLPASGVRADAAAKTLTVPIPGTTAAAFYRVRSDNPVAISKVERVGDDLVVRYQ